MSAIEKLRAAFARRASYRRTRREIAALPVEIAIEDLGINPYDAKLIAWRAIYG